jgi:hypothetical protein
MGKKGGRMNDQLKTVSMVSALFGIMSGDDREGKVKYQKRFFETVNGISFPDDWEKLALEKEKE